MKHFTGTGSSTYPEDLIAADYNRCVYIHHRGNLQLDFYIYTLQFESHIYCHHSPHQEDNTDTLYMESKKLRFIYTA